jgi:hypothetical protein
MNENKVKYIIDVGLLISFILVLVTGVIKFGKLLRAIGINLNYAELPMHEISVVHDWSGVFMGIFVFIHLVLNFDWIIATTKDFFKKKITNKKDGGEISKKI